MDNIINGRQISIEVRKKLAIEIAEIEMKLGIKPKLCVALVGNDSSALAYVKGIQKMSKLSKVDVELLNYDESISQEEFLVEINKINEDDSINGLLVLMPLPSHIKRESVFEVLSPIKDVDGLTSENIGNFYQGLKAHYASTPKGVDHIIDYLGIDVKGMDACVVGASNVVGKPMAELLLQREATVSICHKETKSLIKYTKEADIIVACAGVAHLIKADMVKDDVIIFDVGINFVDGKMVGDVDFDEVVKKAKLITPVPGGVGPMTIATLFHQTFNAFKKMNNL